MDPYILWQFALRRLKCFDSSQQSEAPYICVGVARIVNDLFDAIILHPPFYCVELVYFEADSLVEPLRQHVVIVAVQVNVHRDTEVLELELHFAGFGQTSRLLKVAVNYRLQIMVDRLV